MEKKIIPRVDITTILSLLNFEDETRMVTDEYYKQGFNGEFGRTAHFTIDTDSSKNPAVILHTPAYTNFMLYGRGPGKMPPLEPIESWMETKGLTGSAWAIRKHIAEFGTTGNDFLSPVLGQVKENIVKKIQDAISNAISTK
jgi:hypothetical protein